MGLALGGPRRASSHDIAADADAIVTYGGGAADEPALGIRFHGSHTEASSSVAATSWDDPYVAARSIDQLLDALAQTGVDKLNVEHELSHRRSCAPEAAALLEILLAPTTPPLLVPQEVKQLAAVATGRVAGTEASPSTAQIENAAQVYIYTSVYMYIYIHTDICMSMSVSISM